MRVKITCMLLYNARDLVSCNCPAYDSNITVALKGGCEPIGLVQVEQSICPYCPYDMD